MADKREQEGMLSGYRVLDLCDDRGFYCGKIFADLGADVIKIEPPGGDLSRNIGPFYKDIPHPEKSLYWWAYNTSKRGITLNIETADGKDIFRRLVKTADIIVESFPPGYMDSLGLGYSALIKINPGIIMTSITPFGQTGPYKDYKAPDLVVWALGGQVFATGDDDRPPCRIGFPQAYFCAGNHAASATMAALYWRELSGEGQFIDVSTQEAVFWTLQIVINFWEFMKFNIPRGGVTRKTPWGPEIRFAFPCKDGHVGFTLGSGYFASISMPQMVAWMAREGRLGALEPMKDWTRKDWGEKADVFSLTKEEFDTWQNSVTDFFADKTKAELYEQARKNNIMLLPASNAKELADNLQLKAREFYVEVEHPEVGETITYAGAPYKIAEGAWRISRRAPFIGEHNAEIYERELSLSKEDMRLLKEAGVI